jgi:spore maturation protein CgeB
MPLSSPPWWEYPKLRHSKLKVLLISSKHLLLSEISRALKRLDHSATILLTGKEELNLEVVRKALEGIIRSFRPDFVLTINHLGFDREGEVAGLLTGWKVPFASWYVDSPHLILRHYARNRSPFLTLFLWDEDYLEVLRKLGFERLEYLPLGVDDDQFRPLNGQRGRPFPLPLDVSFVGNSMVIKVRSVLARCGIDGPLLDQFDHVSRAFEASPRLIAKEVIEEQFPDLAVEMARLEESQAIGYETAVTWRATGSYRESLVRRLRPFAPMIIGDAGWEETLKESFRLHRELNYYDDLPGLYNMTKVNFNATSRQMKEGVNQRVFDAPACGGLVVTDWTRQLEKLMEPGRDVLAYRKGEEIPSLVEKALGDDEFRRKVAESGHRRVLREHTYCHRVRHLIEVMRRHHGRRS